MTLFFFENYVQTFLYVFEEILQDMGYFFPNFRREIQNKGNTQIYTTYYVFFILHC